MVSHHEHNYPVSIAEPHCPVCGAFMVEEDRLLDGGMAYVWYACSSSGCGGQRLTQLPAPEGIWDRAQRPHTLGARRTVVSAR